MNTPTDSRKDGGAAELPPTETRYVCHGCPHLKTEDWRDYLDNDETDSGTYATCLKADKHITSYYGQHQSAPNWCPLLAARSQP